MTNATASIVNLAASIAAAFAAIVLAVFAILQWCTMKENNELERERWKRDDLFRSLQWFDSHFNSPAMLVARTAFGRSMLDNENLIDTLSRPHGEAMAMIYFLRKSLSVGSIISWN